MTIINSFEGSAKRLINKIKKAANDNNGNFTGDESEGKIEISRFGARMRGAYKIEGNSITVEVLKKPFFILEKMIQKEIKKIEYKF